MELFFNYSIDCELPPEGKFGGPATWEIAESSVRQFVEMMAADGAVAGTSLFAYPDVARKQPSLFRELAGTGIEIGLHLHGLRYSRLRGAQAKWLGAMKHDEQRNAIEMAKNDLEDAIGRPVTGYRACCASANDDTFPICEELGFSWTSTSVPDLDKPKCHACWSGAWRYPHHPSRVNRLVCGDLALYEMPLTSGLPAPPGKERERPLDLRAETPPRLTGPNFEAFRTMISENIEEMARLDQPVRMIAVGSHNTILFGDPSSHPHQNLLAAIRLTREIADAAGLDFTPATFGTVRLEAENRSAF